MKASQQGEMSGCVWGCDVEQKHSNLVIVNKGQEETEGATQGAAENSTVVQTR